MQRKSVIVVFEHNNALGHGFGGFSDIFIPVKIFFDIHGNFLSEVFGLILVLFSNNIAVFYNNPSLSTLIVYIAFKPVLDNIIAVFQPLFISLKKAKKIAIINVIISIIKVIVVTLGYVITKKIFMQVFLCIR